MMSEQNRAGEEAQVDEVNTPAEEQAATVESVVEAAAELAEGELLEEASVADLEASLNAAEAEVAELKDQMLRVQAEAQNMRRRAELDVDKARKFALEKFANELLPIADNLERAIAACDSEAEAVKPLLEGVEMTLGMFISGLGKFNVEQVDPRDQMFDPNLHQAMTMVPVPGVPANTVIDVMQKGYTLNGRLLRPAMVVVAKGE